MPNFDPISGSPLYDIKSEGQEIQIRIDKTSPTTARISWNIPNGLSCDSSTQIYNGIIITLDTSPVSLAKEPVNGTVYSADPTANRNLHTGNKLDTALVVGAFYDNKTTTYVDVTGLQPNSAYYASGFAVDNTLRYHRAGVHTYSLPFGKLDEPDLAGFQIITLGVQGTTSTGLAASNYTLDFTVDDKEPVTLTINGANASTYDDLINEINKQIALIDSPLQSAGAPNIGAYYWNSTTQKLYQWDGTTHNELNVIVEPSDPSLPIVGDYWYETDTDTLYKWDGASWIVQTVIKYKTDPTALGCDDYWFNGTQAYRWNGDVWCIKTLHNQIINPSLPPVLICPTYWYDTLNSFMYEWTEETNSWKHTDPVLWATDPLLLANGAYWFDLTNNVLKIRNAPNWDTIVNAFIQTTQPTTPADGALWFNTSTDVLKQYALIGNTWNVLPVILWHKDPLQPASCDLWWNTTLDQLNTWDITTSAWVIVSNFVQSAVDPSLPPVLTDDDVWYNPTSGKLYQWDGTNFVEVSFINHLTDPTKPNVNDVWFNTVTNVFSVWSPNWVSIDPKLTPDNPYAPVAGDFWYDTTANSLKQYNGASWVSVLYSAVPLTPTTGDFYFDTNTDMLMTWDGTAWIAATLPAVVGLDADGNLRFDSSTLGSSSYVYAVDGTLFAALTPKATVNDPVRGLDGVSGTPTYIDEDIGTDGSVDERRNIMEDVRSWLGYPIVDVELTKNQLDSCINNALKVLRQKSSSAYRKQYFFITLNPNTQVYKLTDKRSGLNKVVSVIDIHRTRAALVGSGSLWDQAFIQHLYYFGAYDLTSFYLMNEYIETLEFAFASAIQFQWHEEKRQLTILQNIGRFERVILETSVERTEQELLLDRITRPWLEKYTLSEAKMMLSQIRGKYASLPGAGSGISLNASDLKTESETLKQECMDDIDNYVVNDKIEVGASGDFIIG